MRQSSPDWNVAQQSELSIMTSLRNFSFGVLTLILGIVALLIAIRLQGRFSTQESSLQPSSASTSSPAAAPAPLPQQIGANNSSVQSTTPALAAISQPSSLQRGPNNRLLLNPASDLQRNPVAGTVSEATVLAVRSGTLAGPLTVDEHTLSAVEAALDGNALTEFLRSDAESLRLPLTAEREVMVQIERVITRGEVTQTLVGKVQGDSFSDVLITFHDGAIHGSISFFDSDTHYQFAMAGNGDVAIRLLDPATFDAPCGNPGESPADEVAPEGDVEADPPVGSLVMDSVVGYDEQSRIADGGVAAIEARIINSIDRINTAFNNSQIAPTFVSLLAMVEDPDYVFPGAVTGDMGTGDELGDLQTHGDGVLDTVSQLRIDLGADQNAFVVKQADGSAGIAYRPGRSMIVARDYMTSTRITFAHEFGHNIGCRHAWADSSANDPVNVSNYGWRLAPPGGTRVRTIMAYDWDWGSGARIPYFSNPNVSYNGARTGATNGYNATGDSTTDPRFVSGGYIGTAGTGYNGSNPSLGARNADYITASAGDVADNATRAALAVLDPAGGVTWTNSQAYTIFWHGGDHTDLATISLYKSGVLQFDIASNIPAEKRWYSWIVPGNQASGNNYQIRVTLNGASFDNSSTFTISASLSPAQQWRQMYFGTTESLGPAADSFDYDGDGLLNVFERAFGTIPTNAASVTGITYALVDAVGNPGNGYLAITYPRLAGGTPATQNGYSSQGLTYTLEHTTSLTSLWSTSNFSQLGVTPVVNGIESATFRLDIPISSSAAQFVRFKLSAQ